MGAFVILLKDNNMMKQRGAKNSFICTNEYDQNITAIDCVSDDCDNGDTHFDL